jgi:hypothetical protein
MDAKRVHGEYTRETPGVGDVVVYDYVYASVINRKRKHERRIAYFHKSGDMSWNNIMEVERGQCRHS